MVYFLLMIEVPVISAGRTAI